MKRIEDSNWVSGKQVLASALSGAVARYCTHPLDTLRTRAQSSLSPSTSLFRGVNLTVAFGVPGVALYLTTYEAGKSYLLRAYGQSQAAGPDPSQPTQPSRLASASIHLGSGLAAELVSALVWTPMEIVKQQLQVGKADNSWAALRSLSQGGVRQIWKGYPATIAVFAPYSGLYFVAYEELKVRLVKNELGPNPTASFPTYLASSALAAAFAACAVNPIDLVKTRYQLGLGSSFSQIVRGLWRESGLLGFYRGAGHRVLFSVPNVAITMSLYETLKQYC